MGGGGGQAGGRAAGGRAGGRAGRGGGGGGGGLCRCGAAAIGGMGSTNVDSPGQLTLLWLRRRDMGRTILAPWNKS